MQLLPRNLVDRFLAKNLVWTIRNSVSPLMLCRLGLGYNRFQDSISSQVEQAFG